MDKTRRAFLKTTGLGAIAMTLPDLLPAEQKSKTKRINRPNVILVMTDDQGYGDIACHGNEIIKTPTLDKLHNVSVRLSNFHVDPCCAPTRAALLTGRYSARTGVWHTIGGRSLLHKNEVTMADVFKAGGYRTGIFGKWHLGDNYPFRPQDRGFQETLVHGGGAIGNLPDYWGNDYFDDTFFHNGKPEKFEGYCDDVWFDEALRFIRAHRDRPFFCYLPTNIPHAPLRAPEKYIEPYRSRLSERLARYYGMLTKFDENLARLLGEVENLHLEENTIFIFLSDNGPCPWSGGVKLNDDGFIVEGCNAGMRGGKIRGYEGAHRVPCFIRWPAGGIEGGKDINQLTAHFDLLPTLIDCCGLDKPESVKMDGLSIKPLLTAPAADINWPDRTLFVHNQRIDHPQKWKDYQVLTKRWRLIDGTELYDIKTDPGQTKNLAARNPALVRKLRSEYEKWWDDASQNFHVYNEIVVGSDKENPATLWPHDWHGAALWDQSQVKNASAANGVWVIDVARDGKYEIELRRWPRELNLPLNAALKDGKAISVTSARLAVGNIDKTMPVNQKMLGAQFTLHLKAGPTCLQTWFTDEKTKKSRGAYYVYVKRVGPAQPALAAEYRSTKPENILKP